MKVIKNSPHVPKKTENIIEVAKYKNEFDENDWKNWYVNAKALSILHCSLDVNQ